MDKSGIFVGATVGSISAFIIFSILFIIPAESNEAAIQNQIDENELQVQNQIDEINNLILQESKTSSLTSVYPDKATFEKAAAQRKKGIAGVADKIKDVRLEEGQAALALIR